MAARGGWRRRWQRMISAAKGGLFNLILFHLPLGSQHSHINTISVLKLSSSTCYVIRLIYENLKCIINKSNKQLGDGVFHLYAKANV